MTPALEDHLGRMHGLALRAEALACAITVLSDDPDMAEISAEMAAAVTQLTAKLVQGLDRPQRFEGRK